MSNSDMVLSLVSDVYAAAADRTRWPDTLWRITDALGGRGVNLFVFDAESGTIPFNIAVGIPDDRQAEYNERFAAHDPRIAHALRNPQLPVTVDYQHISEREMDRDPYYAWLAAADFRYYLGIAETLGGGLHAVGAVQRARRQGHAEARDVELFTALRPHILRALQLTLKLGGLEAQVQAGADAAEALPYGLIVLDERGRVLMMNAEARRIVETGGVLRAGGEGLRAVRAKDDAALQRLVAGALAVALGLDHAGGGALRLDRPDSPLGYLLHVMPLAGEQPLFALQRPAAILFLHDPARRRPTPAARLRALWGLTEREARLAGLLGEGLSLKDAAERMGVALPTARVHLAAVFRKTGARRQSELIRLLAGLADLSGG